MAKNDVVIKKDEKVVVFPVAIPADFAADLQLKAGESTSIGEFLVKIARRYSDLPLDDDRGFYVTGKHRARIERILNKAMQDPEVELAPAVERCTMLRIGGMKLSFDADLIDRVNAKDIGSQLGLEDYDPTEFWQNLLNNLLERAANGEF